MVHVIAPATSANLGSGFDSIGIALDIYNHIWVEEAERGLEISVKCRHKLIPTDKTNLIYKTIANFYKKTGHKLPGLHITQENNIPITRGLGSSAACIAGGLLAANSLSGANLSKEELMQMAAEIEGHPDNTNPAFLGGMVVGAMDEDQMFYSKIDLPPELSFAVMVPDFVVPTEKARNILPYSVTRNDAIFNSSRAALMVASIVTKKYDNLKIAMDDRLHQPYRLQFLPEMKYIFSRALNFGAKGAALSGSGPALLAVLLEEDAEDFKYKMTEYLRLIPHNWTLSIMRPDYEGAKIITE